MKKFGIVVVLYGKGAGDVLNNFPTVFEKLNSSNIPVAFVDHGGHGYPPKNFARENGIYLTQENRGFGSGVNLGCQALFESCEYAIVLNPDLNFSVDELINIGSGLNKSFAVMETQEGGIKRAIRFYNRLTGVIADRPSTFSIPYFNGAAFCFSRQLFLKTGGFDEKFFLYFEDLDFSLQLRRLSTSLEIIKTNTFVHAVGGSQDMGQSGFIQKAAAKSALRLVWKWFPWNLWLYLRYSLKWLLADLRSSN